MRITRLPTLLKASSAVSREENKMLHFRRKYKMRITSLTTSLKASSALLAMFAVALASQPGHRPNPDALGELTSAAPFAACPPAGYNPSALPNLLQTLNPSFEMQGPNGPSTSHTGVSSLGWSAAANWSVFHNTQGTTRTRLLNSNAPGGGAKMINVHTTGASNGLVNVIGPYNTGTKTAFATAWVYVTQGKVCIGTGNGGNTHCDATSTTTGQWEQLKACSGVSPANEFIVYSVGGAAVFNVDLARVTRVE